MNKGVGEHIHVHVQEKSDVHEGTEIEHREHLYPHRYIYSTCTPSQIHLRHMYPSQIYLQYHVPLTDISTVPCTHVGAVG